ncbi:MAG: hypothetical protein M3P83_04950 [Actinomycetota bacterium]|nr:hypothetical protein [Actinomycetota bacterium]
MRRVRPASLLFAAVTSVGLLASGCGGDDGADVREIDGGTQSGSGSGSGSGSEDHGSGSEDHGSGSETASE